MYFFQFILKIVYRFSIDRCFILSKGFLNTKVMFYNLKFINYDKCGTQNTDCVHPIDDLCLNKVNNLKILLEYV